MLRENLIGIKDVNPDWCPVKLLDAVSTGLKNLECNLVTDPQRTDFFVADKVVEWVFCGCKIGSKRKFSLC